MEGFDGGEGHDDAGLHVEGSGAGDFFLGFAPGHLGEGAVGPDGVEVAEQEDWLACRAGWAEVEFEDVAVSFLFVVFRAGSEFAGPAFDQGAGGVDGAGVFAGGFLLDEFAEVDDEGRLGGRDVLEEGLGVERRRKAYRDCCGRDDAFPESGEASFRTNCGFFATVHERARDVV